jgi:PilZ domain
MTTRPVDEGEAKSERRHFQRKKFSAKLEMEWGSAILTGDVRDIGPRGLFVELNPPLWVGARFLARLNVNPVLLLNCTVARVEAGTGIAVVFEVAEDSGKSQLESLLVSLPPA